MMQKIYTTWSSCYGFRVCCLDYDIRKSEISGIYSMQEGNGKNVHTFWAGYLKGKKLVVDYRCRCEGNIMDLETNCV